MEADGKSGESNTAKSLSPLANKCTALAELIHSEISGWAISAVDEELVYRSFHFCIVNSLQSEEGREKKGLQGSIIPRRQSGHFSSPSTPSSPTQSGVKSSPSRTLRAQIETWAKSPTWNSRLAPIKISPTPIELQLRWPHSSHDSTCKFYGREAQAHPRRVWVSLRGREKGFLMSAPFP